MVHQSPTAGLFETQTAGKVPKMFPENVSVIEKGHKYFVILHSELEYITPSNPVFSKVSSSFRCPAAADFQVRKRISAVFLFCFCRTAAARRLWFFCGIYFHVCSRFPRCCRSRIVRESIKVYFRGIACSLNRDLNFKRLLFKWRTRRDPSLWKGVTP